MLKAPLSPNSKKTKRRQLLSLNRPHNISTKLSNDTPSGPPKSISPTATSPPMTWNQDTVESTRNLSLESTENTLGEYHCPICNKDLSTFNTSYSRQQHIDGCLSSTDPIEENGNDDQSLESLFMNYCSFCGKTISHLKGVRKERHFDQCLTALETEQQLAEQQQKLTTYAGHSIPFLQTLDVCPVCHDSLPGPSLRNKISHIKRCAKNRSMTMEQLLQKIQWMQWGHLPVQNTSSSSAAETTANDSSSSAGSISYSRYATELPSTTNGNTTATARSTPSLTIKKRPTSTNDTIADSTQAMDDDFSTDVLMYKVATHQTRFKKAKQEPTEDESVAMALSLSLMPEDEQPRTLPRKKKQKVNLDVANIVSIEESRALARRALEKMLAKCAHVDDGDVLMTQFPLVTSRVQPTLPRRQNPLPSTPLAISRSSLWTQASCLEFD